MTPHEKAEREGEGIHTIYIDVLFCVNFIIDYMLLLLVKTFLSLSCRLRRLLAGAAVGGITSFVILLPPMPSGFSLIISLASACMIVGTAFAPLSVRVFFKAAVSFFLISFLYCGMMMAIWMLFSPDNIIIRNTTVYIGISPVALVVTAVICYVIIKTAVRITGKRSPALLTCTVSADIGGEELIVIGKVDTGNTLKEPFSGSPVIVVERGACYSVKVLSEMTVASLTPGCRVIPFTSVGGKGMLPAYKAENIRVKYGGIEYHVSAYIAVCEEGMITGGEKAIVPFDIF